MPRRLASMTRAWAHSRTCTTEPAPRTSCGSAIVWMLSTTTSDGARAVDGGDHASERRLAGQPQVGPHGRRDARRAGGPAAALSSALTYSVVPGHARQQLQQQRALADARLAAEQGDRPGDEPAAEHPVELGDARRLGRGEQGIDVREQVERRHRHRPAGHAAPDGGGRAPPPQRVPRPAPGALPGPLGMGRAALAHTSAPSSSSSWRQHDERV